VNLMRGNQCWPVVFLLLSCFGLLCRQYNWLMVAAPTKLDELLKKRRDQLAPIFRSRIALVEKVCTIEPMEEVTTKSKSWFAHPDHKLLLCHMGKHGSTTWASYFYYMYTGQEPERPGPSMQTRARRWEDAAYSPREKVEVISSNRQGQPNYNYFSFFVCRNPVCQSWVQSMSTT